MSPSRRWRGSAGNSGEQPLHTKGDKAGDAATLSRLPVSSCNYTPSCFSFTSPGTINGLEAAGRLAPGEWASKPSADSCWGSPLKMRITPSLRAHARPPGTALTSRPRNHSLIVSAPYD